MRRVDAPIRVLRIAFDQRLRRYFRFRVRVRRSLGVADERISVREPALRGYDGVERQKILRPDFGERAVDAELFVQLIDRRAIFAEP